ncbi:MAG: type II toxin-antitoxin system RelE/ParE family toxin [Chloroflexi bacterium]|nr:type II toxin-antitoxin system RelE/ParE family toxin [Chloroflexota bacterium]
MASYEIRLTHSATKELEDLSKPIVQIVWQKLRALAKEPRPRRVKKLKGTEKAYRLRIRDYRIIYTIDDKQKLVVIKAVRHRKDLYRG